MAAPRSRTVAAATMALQAAGCLVVGAILAGVILTRAREARLNQEHQYAFDSQLMLVSPLAFMAVGLWLGVRSGLVLLRPHPPGIGGQTRNDPADGVSWTGPSQPRRRPAKRRNQTMPPPSPIQAPDPAPTYPDRYCRACAELGLEPGVSWEVIRATWRRKLPLWHPDRGGDQERWLRKQAAYNLLQAWEQFRL
ncbi:J domain-containing protein [Synechococcus sp. RSCCF101]|uniref:J domain-containing protein n=1 Tax=Synechococcus sp. RSCCF101 TaxID=2511069 RepID=UPI001244CF40|nr:J domain-containing protein [Synechococcus sp. RSCCF101]QEY32721.1 J domain-containing protein [Synechococcus sp. RSCCF101]